MTAFVYFDVHDDEDIVEIRLANPISFDVGNFAELRDELFAFVDQYRPGKLIVDFSEVQYCSTAIMSALLFARARLQSYGGQMKFCGMNGAVRQSFQRLDLDGTVFDIRPTTVAAMNAF